MNESDNTDKNHSLKEKIKNIDRNDISIVILFSPVWGIIGLGMFVMLRELYRYIFG